MTHSNQLSWEEAFNKGFSFEGNNDPNDSPKMLFTIWKDGTRSIATPEYVKAFIKQAISSHHTASLLKLKGEIEGTDLEDKHGSHREGQAYMKGVILSKLEGL